jgi:hypothetical protein
MIKITAEQAVEILEVVGSDQDPICYRGTDTTAAELVQDMEESARRLACNVAIKFSGGPSGRVHPVKGTLHKMVEDRLMLR